MLKAKKLVISVLAILTIGAAAAFADSDWSGTGTHPSGATLAWSGTWYESPDPDIISGEWQVAGYLVAWLCDFEGEVWPSFNCNWDHQSLNGTWRSRDEDGPTGTFRMFFVDNYCYGTWTIDGVAGTGSLSGNMQ